MRNVEHFRELRLREILAFSEPSQILAEQFRNVDKRVHTEIMSLEREKENSLLWNKYTCKYVKPLTFYGIAGKMDFVRYIYTLRIVSKEVLWKKKNYSTV